MWRICPWICFVWLLMPTKTGPKIMSVWLIEGKLVSVYLKPFLIATFIYENLLYNHYKAPCKAIACCCCYCTKTSDCATFSGKKYFLLFTKVGTLYHNLRWLGHSGVSCRWRRGGICRKRMSPIKRSYFFGTEEIGGNHLLISCAWNFLIYLFHS